MGTTEGQTREDWGRQKRATATQKKKAARDEKQRAAKEMGKLSLPNELKGKAFTNTGKKVLRQLKEKTQRALVPDNRRGGKKRERYRKQKLASSPLLGAILGKSTMLEIRAPLLGQDHQRFKRIPTTGKAQEGPRQAGKGKKASAGVETEK